jgi:hypothetical protein
VAAHVQEDGGEEVKEEGTGGLGAARRPSGNIQRRRPGCGHPRNQAGEGEAQPEEHLVATDTGEEGRAAVEGGRSQRLRLGGAR